MPPLTTLLSSALVLGLGATLTFDLWGQLLKLAFQVPPSNICLVGRWVLYMPEGRFYHARLAATAPKRWECAAGWLAHYLIGTGFAAAFVALAGRGWLQRPTLAPALAFGLMTALAPLFVMQPLFGLGWASAKAANPTQARLRTLLNHAAFGGGLFLFAWLLSLL